MHVPKYIAAEGGNFDAKANPGRKLDECIGDSECLNNKIEDRGTYTRLVSNELRRGQ